MKKKLVESCISTMIVGEVNYPDNTKKGRKAEEWKGLVRRCPVFLSLWGYINHLFLVTFIENLIVSALGQNGRLLLMIGLLVFKNLLKIRVDLCFDSSFHAFNQEGKIAPRKCEEIDYCWLSTKQGLWRAVASLIRPTYSVYRDVLF